VRVNGEMQEGEGQLCDAAFINSQWKFWTFPSRANDHVCVRWRAI